MTDSDRPISFLVRGTMLRSQARDAAESPEDESAEVGPRGLPHPRLKTPPPPRSYREKTREVPIIHPDDIVTFFGRQFWNKDGKQVPMPQPGGRIRKPREKAPLRPFPEPTPGVMKPARGRQVPKDAEPSANRRYVCPVEECRKAFTKRTHLSRHIGGLHTHEKKLFCMMHHCNKSFRRPDNLSQHQKRCGPGAQEIVSCNSDNKYKGVLFRNPLVNDNEAFNIKPFANIAIHPNALALWRHREKMHARGMPKIDSACERYFRDKPEERAAALAQEPQWVWRMPEPGDEFEHVGRGCLKGQFQLKIGRDGGAEGEVEDDNA